MVIKVNQTLKDYEGKLLTEKSNVDGKVVEKEVKLRTILVNVLNYMDPNPNEKSSTEDKLKAYKLSIEIMSKDEVDFKIEELALIKKNCNLMYTPLIVGQVVMMIEDGKIKEVKTN